MRRCWLPAVYTFLGCCYASVLPAQSLTFSFHSITREQGLGFGNDYFISRDRYGFIWIGTEEGLNRYDGKRIEHYTPATRDVQVTSPCFEDKVGNLWFSTFSAVQCYRRETATIRSFPSELQDLGNMQAFHLDTDQKIWLTAGSGERSALYCFDIRNGQYRRIGSVAGKCQTAVCNQHGAVIQVVSTMLTDEPGLVITDIRDETSKKVQFDRLPDGKPRRSSPTKHVWLEGDSILWAGLYNALGRYDLRTGHTSIVFYRSTEVMADVGWMNDITRYDDRRLLVATGEGLLIFDRMEHRFSQQISYRPGLPNPLPSGEIHRLYRDVGDQLWLSGPGDGIAFTNLYKNKFSVIPQTVGTQVTSLFSDKYGRIWCSTSDSGLYVFDRERALLFRSRDLDNRALPGQHFSLPAITVFWENKMSGLWAFSDNNALQWEPGSGQFVFKGKNFFGVATTQADQIRLFPPLNDGVILAAKGSSLYAIHTTDDQVLLHPWKNLEALGLQHVTAVFQSRNGRVFIADNRDRILAADVSGGRVRKLAEWTDTGECTGFTQTGDFLVWAAGSKGLFQISLNSWKGHFPDSVSGGLSAERYYEILPDRNGQLWLTGNNGIIRYNPQTGNWHRFNTQDGLLSALMTPKAALTVPATGEFWVGGKNGVNVFRPEAIRLLDVPPGVQWTRLLINDTIYKVGYDLALLEYLDLDYKQNTLALQFAALDLSVPGDNKFYYRLRGIERDSISNGTQGFVRYPNLPAGDYVLEVWAANSDGMLTPQPRRLRIHIRPPFWQTWWFYLLSICTVAGLIFAWFQYRLRQALKIERMRVQISSDLHDDVGTLLSGLAMQSEVLELTAADQDKGKLQRIGQISRDAMARMRDTVWAIDARKDKLENLFDRMREFAEEMLIPRGFRFVIDGGQINPKQNMPAQFRQSLYLIFKEAVTNSIKHSNGDLLTVSFKKQAAGFEMRICDNGKVPEKTYVTTGSGTSNMRIRAEKIGGSLEINRENGFCVVVRW